MSTINITPFTDVLLVLLIIFIILASVTKEPHLPEAKNKDKVTPSQIVVIIDEKDHVQIGSRTFTNHELPQAFTDLAAATNHNYKSVIIKADPKATYGTILEVMDAAKSANLTNFGLANKVEGAPDVNAPAPGGAQG